LVAKNTTGAGAGTIGFLITGIKYMFQ